MRSVVSVQLYFVQNSQLGRVIIPQICTFFPNWDCQKLNYPEESEEIMAFCAIMAPEWLLSWQSGENAQNISKNLFFRYPPIFAKFKRRTSCLEFRCVSLQLFCMHWGYSDQKYVRENFRSKDLPNAKDIFPARINCWQSYHGREADIFKAKVEEAKRVLCRDIWLLCSQQGYTTERGVE